MAVFDTSTLTIDKNIPLPTEKWAALINRMEIGDSVDFPLQGQAHVFFTFIRKHGGDAVKRNMRVWLIRKPTETGDDPKEKAEYLSGRKMWHHRPK